MFDTLQVLRISKLTQCHKENISNKAILLNIVNAGDARRVLTSEQMNSFNTVFQRIAKQTQATPTDLKNYEDRAFCIAHEFHMAGLPYEKICGSASDILYMFTNKVKEFDEFVVTVANWYYSLLKSWVKESSKDPKYICALTYIFSLCLPKGVVSYNAPLQNDVVMNYYFSCISECILNQYIKTLPNEIGDITQMIAENLGKLKSMNKEAISNNSYPYFYIQRITQSFLTLMDVSPANYQEDIMTMAKRWIEYK